MPVSSALRGRCSQDRGAAGRASHTLYPLVSDPFLAGSESSNNKASPFCTALSRSPVGSNPESPRLPRPCQRNFSHFCLVPEPGLSPHSLLVWGGESLREAAQEKLPASGREKSCRLWDILTPVLLMEALIIKGLLGP